MEAMKEKGEGREAMGDEKSDVKPETVESESTIATMRSQEPAHGYCLCGCGQKTNVSPTTDTSKGYKKGEPYKYIQGHGTKNRQKPAMSVKPKAKTRPAASKPYEPETSPFLQAHGVITDIPDYQGNGVSKKLLQLPDGEHLVAALEKLAADNFRTVNDQAAWELVKILRDSSVASLPQNDKL